MWSNIVTRNVRRSGASLSTHVWKNWRMMRKRLATPGLCEYQKTWQIIGVDINVVDDIDWFCFSCPRPPPTNHVPLPLYHVTTANAYSITGWAVKATSAIVNNHRWSSLDCRRNLCSDTSEKVMWFSVILLLDPPVLLLACSVSRGILIKCAPQRSFCRAVHWVTLLRLLVWAHCLLGLLCWFSCTLVNCLLLLLFSVYLINKTV